mgnify:CR=1 FL=1
MKLDFSELLQPQGSEPARKRRETAPAGNAAATDSTQAIIKALESGGDIYAIALMLCDALADNLHNELFRQRLGHENIETTLNIYGHLYKGQDADIANLLNAL